MSGCDPGELGRALVDSAAEAIIYADRDGMIRLWNAGAERLFGYTAAEAVGESLDIIIPPKLRERHWEGYYRVMNGGESRYGPGDLLAVPGLHKNGERVSLEFTVVPLHDESGAMVGMASVLRDVTERWNEMKRLKSRVQQLEAGGSVN